MDNCVTHPNDGSINQKEQIDTLILSKRKLLPEERKLINCDCDSDTHCFLKECSSLFRTVLPEYSHRHDAKKSINNSPSKWHLNYLNRYYALMKIIIITATFLFTKLSRLSTMIHRTKGEYKMLPIIHIFLLILISNSASAFCPSGCECNDVTLRVECKNASLDVVPFLLNPGIQYLRLPCNKINSLGESLAFYPELIALDLSFNSLMTVNPNDFESQSSLKILKLDNNKIIMIKNDSFTGLDDMKELFLNNNKISHLEWNSFYNLDNLLFLDLSNNRIRILREEQLSPLQSLEVLILNFNKIKTPFGIAFKSLPSLQKLELNGNLITKVPDSAFSHLKHLTSLSLNINGIGTISSNAFNGLSNLTSLSLVDNRLAFIPSGSFHSLPNLEVLDISGNMFQSLQRSPFLPLKKLRELRVSRCPRLSKVGPNAFSGVAQVEHLDLSHNARLARIGDTAFTHLHQLNYLDLSACNLIFVHQTQMPSGQQLPTKLHLEGNPLHCNCTLLWLAKVPINTSFYLDDPTCATPPDLYGVGVARVDLQKVGCEASLGLTAVGICIGVSLLGLLVIGLFLVWRWRRRELASAKALPYCRRDRIPSRSTLPNHSQHPPFHTPPYHPKNAFPPPVPFPQYSLHRCHRECQGVPIGSCPYSLHPATRPLLPPPTPSPTSHSFLPSEWLYPSPYEEDTHWYTTIGRDGREYLTGELKRNTVTPSPVHPPTTPSPSAKLKRNNSVNRLNLVSASDTPPIPGVPVTYI